MDICATDTAPVKLQVGLPGILGLFLSGESLIAVACSLLGLISIDISPPCHLRSEQDVSCAAALMILPESPRWLVVNNRLDEALLVIRKVYMSAGLADGMQSPIRQSLYSKMCACRQNWSHLS